MKKGFFLFILLALAAPLLWAQEIKSVNFVQEGEVSKLIIEGDKDMLAERFHVTEDKQIILDLKNVNVAPKFLRGIDTSEFPGSAVYISGYRKPGTAKDVRFAVQLRDNVRSVLEMKQNKVILSIENRFGVFSQSKIRSSEGKEDAPMESSISLHVPKSNSIEDILENLTLSGPKKYIGKRISINVKDIPVPDLLNMIVETSGFNVIINDDVSKRPPLTLTLTNVPWDQALDTILNLSKLIAKKNANILVVQTEEMASAERKAQLDIAEQKRTLEPLVTRVFLINYASLEEISKIIKDYMTPERSALQVDSRTNSLIVKDTVESMERLKKIIETLDTQTPQILIEAKIVEANESYSKRIGLSRGITFGYDPLQSPLAPSVGPGFSFSSAPTADAPGVMGMTIGIYRRLLNLDFNLQLMESEAKGRVISTPRVVTQNKRPASITSSEQTSYRVQQASTGNNPALATFEKVSADLSLTVTPQVTNEGTIGLEIQLNKSAFGTRPSTDSPPDMTTRNVKTNVMVENGSTIVIGGLYQTSTLETVSGVPFLKDLPLIGWLFRSPYAPDTNKNELIIFMTPRIMNRDETGVVERQATGSGVTSTQL